MISNYLLNYFPGLDIEKRNCHGFTALMKAAMQGRAECVRALMLAGRTQTFECLSLLQKTTAIQILQTGRLDLGCMCAARNVVDYSAALDAHNSYTLSLQEAIFMRGTTAVV